MKMDGRLGLNRRRGRTMERAALVGGQELRQGGLELTAEVPAGREESRGFPRRKSASAGFGSTRLSRRATGWRASGSGSPTTESRTPSIRSSPSVVREGEGSVISLGDVSLVRGYEDERITPKG